MFKERSFVCMCRNRDHVVAFTRWETELSVEVRLNSYMSFWKRLVAALKFVFKSEEMTECHWDTVLLSSDDSKELINLLEEHVEISSLYQKKEDDNFYLADQDGI